ncbi:hypothetical protein ZIOFF_068448 [Zingiber officinale]|uniref:Uncharacterized protein n=1 Tax=Zingiber officinale TaxID=94328 RepID=A0A8J5EVM6_ZINOF|nr:hypothetical protein ZIOFF_068448 [Zingiber officinale]
MRRFRQFGQVGANALLEFARVVKEREQVVAGTLHHLTVEEVESWLLLCQPVHVTVLLMPHGDATNVAPPIASGDLHLRAPSFVFVDAIDAIAGRHARKDPRRCATFNALIAQLIGE